MPVRMIGGVGWVGVTRHSAALQARTLLCAIPLRGDSYCFFTSPLISAACAFVLGGDEALPGGECDPDASSGLLASGVTGDAYGPGSTQGGVSCGAGTVLPAGGCDR